MNSRSQFQPKGVFVNPLGDNSSKSAPLPRMMPGPFIAQMSAPNPLQGSGAGKNNGPAQGGIPPTVGAQILTQPANALRASEAQAGWKEEICIPTANALHASSRSTSAQAVGKEVFIAPEAQQGWSGQTVGSPSPRFSLPVATDIFAKPQSASVVPAPVAPPPVQSASSAKKPEPWENKQRRKGKQSKRGLIIASVVGIILLLGVIVVASAVFASKSSPDVTLYKVGAGTANSPISGGGIIFPRQQLDISYPAAERVIAVLVNAGASITKNQSLIQLDPSQLNAEVTQASNDLAAAQAYLNTVTASRNPLTIAQAQQAYNVAKNKYDALVAEAASPTLHHGTLVSPMDGVVTAVNVNAGEVFSANTPLLTIMDESTVIVHVKIPLSDLGQVHSGQTAMVIPSALPKLNLAGKVLSIVPEADPQTDTFEVWIEVPNANMSLLPGMSAFVRIQGQGVAYGRTEAGPYDGGRDTSGPYALPRLAVLYAEDEPTVFVMRGEQVYVQRVHVVGRSVETIYVDNGVHAGDRVVLVGLDTVHNGQKVHISHIEG